MQGDVGDRGVIGERGSQGAMGLNGPQGTAGLQGSTGAAGIYGQGGSLVNLYYVQSAQAPSSATTGQIYVIGKDKTVDGWNNTFYISRAYFIDNELYEGSDERAKNFVEDIPVDFGKLSMLPKKFFYWKKGFGNVSKRTIGTSAQELEKIYPEIVSEDKDGFKSVSYEKLSIIALAAIDKLNERISALEAKLK